MRSITQPGWYLRFVAEMEAIGCRFTTPKTLFGDDDIEVPRERMSEAQAIIAKYSTQKARRRG